MLRIGLRADVWAEVDKSPGGLKLSCCDTLCCQTLVGARMTMKGWEASTCTGAIKGLLVSLSVPLEAGGTGHSSRPSH